MQSQSYGPEARGGASKSEVVISDAPIDFPKATAVDALLALTQEACDKYSRDLERGGRPACGFRHGAEDAPGNFSVVGFPHHQHG